MVHCLYCYLHNFYHLVHCNVEQLNNIPSVDPHYKQRKAIKKKALKKIVYSYCCGIDPQEKASYGKNGADCYSKNGHAVTDLTRQS